jgi:hypothetical protein
MGKTSGARVARPIKHVQIVIMCGLLAACVSPGTPSRMRVGLLPVRVPEAPTIYNPGFKEGFDRLYLDPVEMGTSNTAGDIILLAIWLLSIPVGIVGGIVEDLDDPSPEEIERVAAFLAPRVPEFDLGPVVREAILERLAGIRDGVADGSMRPVHQVVSVESRSEASGQKLHVVLEVEIQSINVSSPWDENPGGPIVLDAVARLLDPESGAELFQHRGSNEAVGVPLDWEVLENGDIEGFALALTNDLRVAAESLAAEIVKAYWSRPELKEY